VLFDRGPKPDLFLFLMGVAGPIRAGAAGIGHAEVWGERTRQKRLNPGSNLFRSLAATLARDALRIHRRNFAQAELGEKRLRPGSILFCLLTSAKTRTSFKLGQLLPKLPTERAFVRRSVMQKLKVVQQNYRVEIAANLPCKSYLQIGTGDFQ